MLIWPLCGLTVTMTFDLLTSESIIGLSVSPNAHRL